MDDIEKVDDIDEGFDFENVFSQAKKDIDAFKNSNNTKYDRGGFRVFKENEKQRKNTLGRLQKGCKVVKEKNTPAKIVDITIQYKGDSRKNLCIVKSCVSCGFSYFESIKNVNGYCLLATDEKFRNSTDKLIIPTKVEYFKRNKAYISMNWVHTCFNGYCEGYSASKNKLTRTLKWLFKYVYKYNPNLRINS